MATEMEKIPPEIMVDRLLSEVARGRLGRGVRSLPVLYFSQAARTRGRMLDMHAVLLSDFEADIPIVSLLGERVMMRRLAGFPRCEIGN